MTRRRPGLGAAAAALAVLVLAGAAHAAPAPSGLSATVDRTRITTELGRTFVFRSTIANTDTSVADGLIAHLNIVSLTGSAYVDPEDWSTNRTIYLRRLAPGNSQAITWRVKAVNSGDFGVYVAVFRRSGDGRPPVTAPLIAVAVAGRTTLNAGGILTVALAVPSILALLAIGLRLKRRRA